MKKLLLILLVLIAFISNAQDITPLPSTTIKKLIAPNSPTFYYNTIDSAFWVFKGETGWLRMATNAQLQKYYVPYSGAIKDLNLNTHSILAEGQQLPLSNGACQIPTFTDNGNGTVTIGSGDYHLSSLASGKGTKKYTLSGGTFTMTNLASNYIVADYNNGSPYIYVITDVTLINETTIVPIYTVFRNGTYLHTQNWDALGLALANKIHQSIVKTQRYRREFGLILSESGTHNLNLTNGKIWTGAVPIDLTAIASLTDNLFFWRHVGGVWTPSLQTTYNFTQYDNGTNLVDLTANRYAINWVFRGVESQKHLYIVAGSGDYTENQAISAPLPAIPIAISSHSVLVAKLIIQKNAATALSIQSAFDTQFGLSAIQSHGDLTGRDAVDSHPAGAITNTPYSTTSSTTMQLAINELTDEKAPVSGSGNYIHNGTSQQNGNYNINGKGIVSDFQIDKSSGGIGDPTLRISQSNNLAGVDIYEKFGDGRVYFDQFYQASPSGIQFRGKRTDGTWAESLYLRNDGDAVFSNTIQATTAKLTNLTNGYIPYHISDASGLVNSPICTDGTNVGINSLALYPLDVNGVIRSYNVSPELKLQRVSGNQPKISFGSTNESNFFMEANSATGALTYEAGIVSGWGGIHVFSTDGVEKVRISNTGNILAVSGSIYGNTTLTLNGLASTNARLLSSSSTGQITPITNTNGYLKNTDGVFTYDTPPSATNLTYTPSPTNGIVVSDAGTDATIPAGSTTNASLMLPADKTKLDGLYNPSVQTLSGTTPTWNVNNGINATITLTGGTTITLSNLVVGTSGNLTVINDFSIRTLTFSGYTNKISQAVYSTTNRVITSGSNRIDVFSWYYNGTYLIWNGGNFYQ